MQTLLALTDAFIALVPAAAGDIVVAAAPNGETLADSIRDFIAPLFLLAIGIAALTFLFQRETTKFLQFGAITVGVALFFYFPGVVEGIASLLAKALGGA